MSEMWTFPFWKDVAERAIKTTAQTGAGLLSAQGIGVLDIDWKAWVSVVGLTAIYSVLTSIGSAPIGKKGTASVVK